MTTTEQVEALIATLKPAEKARVLQEIVKSLGEAYPGIEANPGVSGGDPCIVRTHIPVWTLEQARRLGTTEVELLQNYPTLRAEDLANAWAFVRGHRPEIDRQIAEHEAA